MLVLPSWDVTGVRCGAGVHDTHGHGGLGVPFRMVVAVLAM